MLDVLQCCPAVGRCVGRGAWTEAQLNLTADGSWLEAHVESNPGEGKAVAAGKGSKFVTLSAALFDKFPVEIGVGIDKCA